MNNNIEKKERKSGVFGYEYIIQVVMMKKISICIPTFNRKNALEALVKELVLNFKNEDICAIVVDNASEDGTEEMMKRISHNNLIYLRNDHNLGADGNYIRIMEEGKKISEYSLWLGDDDLIKEDFWIDIPRLLKQEEPDLIILNADSEVDSEWRLNSVDDEIITNVHDLFYNYYDKMPFGVLVVKNDLLNIEKAKRYKGTYHLYSGAIWEMLDEKYQNSGQIKVYITAKAYIQRGTRVKKFYDGNLNTIYSGIGKFYASLPDSLDYAAEKVIHYMVRTYSGEIYRYMYEEYLKEHRKRKSDYRRWFFMEP